MIKMSAKTTVNKASYCWSKRRYKYKVVYAINNTTLILFLFFGYG